MIGVINRTIHHDLHEKMTAENLSSELLNANEPSFIGENPKYLMITTIAWSLIAIVGILANMCVIVVMLCSSRLKSATHYFITNLAISDSLFLLISPTLALINIHKLIIFHDLPTIIGIIICKADYYLTHLTVFITCLTLMSMTLDRYMAIMYPLKSLVFRSKTKAILINLAIWIVSVILCIPHGYFRVLVQESNISFCTNSEIIDEPVITINQVQILNYGQLNILYTIIISYIIPLIVVVYCYFIMLNKLTKEKLMVNESTRHNSNESHKRRRVLIMIALVTILFGVSWLPIHGFHLALRFLNNFPYENGTLFIFKTVAHTLTYMNSMLNPFLYTIMGNNFRKQIFAKKARYSSRFKTFTRTAGVVNGRASAPTLMHVTTRLDSSSSQNNSTKMCMQNFQLIKKGTHCNPRHNSDTSRLVKQTRLHDNNTKYVCANNRKNNL